MALKLQERVIYFIQWISYLIIIYFRQNGGLLIVKIKTFQAYWFVIYKSLVAFLNSPVLASWVW
jgi:hypothetical protein